MSRVNCRASPLVAERPFGRAFLGAVAFDFERQRPVIVHDQNPIGSNCLKTWPGTYRVKPLRYAVIPRVESLLDRDVVQL